MDSRAIDGPLNEQVLESSLVLLLTYKALNGIAARPFRAL